MFLMDGAVRLAGGERIRSVWRTSHHVGERASGRKRIWTLHRRTQQEWRAIGWHRDEVRHLMLHTERERPAIADDQRCAPWVRPEHVRLPARPVCGIRCGTA